MVPEIQRAEIEIGGKILSFETGRMAGLTNCSVVAKIGETKCLVASVMSEKPREGIDFLPLTVNFEERMYAAGKIPGGFIKREGRPGEPSVLAGRIVDRPIRPLFPDGIRNEINVTLLTLSSDCENIPDMVGLNGATCSLLLSDIPFHHTVAGVRIAKIDGEYIFFPTYEQKDASPIDLILVGTRDKIVMIEGNCNEVSEDDILNAVNAGHEVIRKICDCLDEFRSRAGKEKQEVVPPAEAPDDLKKSIEKIVLQVTEDIYKAEGKKARDSVFSGIREKVDEYLKEYIEKLDDPKLADEITRLGHDWEFKTIRKIIRENILKNDRRPDERKPSDIRNITCEVGLTERAHGSSLFTRGETQVMGTVTLGAPGNIQILDDIHPYLEKRYIHHYQSMPFSFGETGFMRGIGRREIGHGALAERAVLPMIPDQESFPYVIRVNSD
ncbi:polyribonucleotide nucleotidyltransferase, partial [bacterium]|nr:polyribonucleotide nucleotidyltransferase [bacterium]MBU1025476.1 polyribonucleotide nucleotidyltransferase [bacterium]